MRDDDHVILAIPKGRVHATCIHVWNRGVAHWIMSTSSGPKECMVNDALTLMDRTPDSDAVALMSLPGPAILYLIHVRDHWEDVNGMIPQIETTAGEESES